MPGVEGAGDVTWTAQPQQLCSPPCPRRASHPIALCIAVHAGSRGAPGMAVAVPSRTQDHLLFLFQQQQLQHLSHHASPIPLTPHPSSMPPSSLSGASGTPGLLALSGALMAQSQLAAKEDRVAQDGENRGKGKKHSWINPSEVSPAPSVLGRHPRGARAALGGILLPALPVSPRSSMPGSCSLGPGGAASAASDRSS